MTEKDIGNIVDDAIQKSNEQIKRLQETEWQRWMPGLSVYRFVKDNLITDDHWALDTMHSKAYEFTLVTYNSIQTSALLTAGMYGIHKLLNP